VLEVGGFVDGSLTPAVRTLAPVDGLRLPGRIRSISTAADGLVLRLRSGLLVRLGDAHDVRLKLSVAALVIPKLADGTAYLDVSVPERPVSGSVAVLAAPLANTSSDVPAVDLDEASQQTQPQVEVEEFSPNVASETG
jgi:hypothetical protein